MRFGIEADGDVWFLTAPGGEPFFSLGVDCVNAGDLSKELLYRRHGADAAWLRRWARARWDTINAAGFNTLGCWHSPIYWPDTTPKSAEIRISRNSPRVNRVWGHGFPDVFDPGFRESAWNEVHTFLQDGGDVLLENDALIGLYCDNELHWWGSRGDWGENDLARDADCLDLVDDYIRLPAAAPGKQAWVDHLRSNYGTIAALNSTWGSQYTSFDELTELILYRAPDDEFDRVRRSFLELIATRFFEIAQEVYDGIAPGTLRLGCRFAGFSTPETVLKVAGKYCDVISVNFYAMELPSDYLRYLHETTGRPIMITEFAFAEGVRAGFAKSTNGAQKVLVGSQADRAAAYDRWISDGMKLPFLVGQHWFALYDYHNTSGLVGNYGLFNGNDEPYGELLAGMAKTHARVVPAWRDSIRR